MKRFISALNQNEVLYNSFLQIGYFVVLWTILYIVVHNVFRFTKVRATDLDIKNRIVSIMHGTLSFLFSSIFIYYVGIDFDLPIDMLSTKLVSLSLGYFIYDLIACLWFGLWDSKLIIHHVLAICGFSFPFFIGRGIFSGIIGLMLAESSNFPMHFRVILKQMGYRHTRIYEVFDNMYLFIYMVARGVVLPIFCVMSFFSKETHLITSFIFLAMTLQSFQFINIMFSIIRGKKKKALERKSKGVELFWFSVNPQIKELDYFKKTSKQNIF